MKSYVCLTAALLTTSVAWAQPVFINLGPKTQATSVSIDGDVVVGTKAGSIFRWTQASGMTFLGSGFRPEVSADGSAVAWVQNGSVYRWTAAGGTTLLGTGGATTAAISGDGSTVVSGSHRWTTAGWSSNLQLPAGATGNLNALSVNYDGSLVSGDSETGVPIRWDGTGQGTSLGAIPGYAVNGIGSSITPDGNTIVGFARGNNGFDVFRWRQSTGMRGLQVAPMGFTGPAVYDVTPDGEIVVGTNLGNAFLWRAGGGPMDIRTLLEEQYGVNVANLTVEFAYGISGDGRTLVGWGFDSNVNANYGWVLRLDGSIPAPGSACMLLASLSVLRRRRRR